MKEAFFGPSLSEDEILKQVGSELLQKILDLGKPIVRSILTKANDNGFPVEYLQYVFWLLMENPKGWPSSLTKGQKEALHLLRSILANSGDLPAYRSGLEVPPGEYESALDDTLEDLSIFAQKLAIPIEKEYSKILKSYDKAIRKANPEIPKKMGLVYLKSAFERALRDSPRDFEKGQLLYRVFTTLFP